MLQFAEEVLTALWFASSPLYVQGPGDVCSTVVSGEPLVKGGLCQVYSNS